MINQLTPGLSVLAQALPSGGPDWLYQFSNNLSNLTTQNGGALTQIGLTELSFVSLMVLVGMVSNWSIAGMTLSSHRHPMRAGDFTQFMMRLIFCLLLENYWVNPIPGASFGFNHLFSYLAQVIVRVIDQNSLTLLQAQFEDITRNTVAPSFTAPIEILCYVLVIILLGLASAVLFLINVSGFILYGVSALFGPIFIPLYMTKTFRGKFLNFVDVLLSFAMIRAVASAFIFVWGGFLIAFTQQTFNHDYSMKMWIANLVPCLMVFAAFFLNMLYVPSITQTLFGGGAGLASKIEETAAKFLALL